MESYIPGYPEHCEQFQTIQKPNGSYKTEHLYSYVALMTSRRGDGCVLAIRMDYCKNKTDVAMKLKEYAQAWNVKGVWRLYDEDFDDNPELHVPDSLAAFMNPPEGGEKR